MNGLGVRQRRMLVAMLTHGGQLPPGWRLHWHDRDVLRSLWERALTTDWVQASAALTERGRVTAQRYQGDRL